MDKKNEGVLSRVKREKKQKKYKKGHEGLLFNLFHVTTTEVAREYKRDWLIKAILKKETENTVVTVQEQRFDHELECQP